MCPKFEIKRSDKRYTGVQNSFLILTDLHQLVVKRNQFQFNMQIRVFGPVFSIFAVSLNTQDYSHWNMLILPLVTLVLLTSENVLESGVRLLCKEGNLGGSEQ